MSLILGIESSCDETSVAVVEDGRKVLSNVISSQIDIHKLYGGVVPEIASRRHCESIIGVVNEALEKAGKTAAEMDAIAAVVVGGTSMSGGSGKVGGTFIGCLIIGFLNNGLNLMNVDSFWQYVVKGIVILLAVFIDFFRNRK